MPHITGHDRSQTLVLPEAPDDYVAPDNPVRFIDAFVDGLDLTEAGFADVEPKSTGRPGYAPCDLLSNHCEPATAIVWRDTRFRSRGYRN
jgi:transposase